MDEIIKCVIRGLENNTEIEINVFIRLQRPFLLAPLFTLQKNTTRGKKGEKTGAKQGLTYVH